MTAQLPPNPGAYRSLSEWANAFYDFYINSTRVDQANDPLPILLPHKVTGDERATTDGIAMWEPEDRAIVVSTSGAWARVAPAPVAYTAAQIADVSHVVNTQGKWAGKVVYDSTNDTLVIANGPAAADSWSRLTVASTVNPA